MNNPTQPTIDDLGAVIGVRAVMRLLALHGEVTMHVPFEITPAHQLVVAIGPEAAARLVEAFGGESITLAGEAEFAQLRLVRLAARFLKKGVSPRDIAESLGVTSKAVGVLRREAESIGLLPLVLDGRDD